MKNTRNERHSSRKSAIVALVILVFCALAVGLLFGYRALRDLWLDQCVIRDFERQVSINEGKMVKADVLARALTLTNGANLATINFSEKRREILAKVPNLREISISRRLPDRVAVNVEEREPVARVNISGRRRESGRVVDLDGVVFLCQRGTRSLPVIREPSGPGTPIGGRLKERGLAALQLIDTCRDTEFQDFGILEIDITKPDYLLVTLGGTYARVKLAWEGMDERTAAAKASLVRQLSHLKSAMRSHIGDGAIIWNATDFSKPGRIYADTKGNL